jgi:hypothetical protein
MRLKSNRVHPTRFKYMGEKGVKSVVIAPYGTVEIEDFVSTISEVPIENGWLEIVTEAQVKMMNAEKDAMSYIETKTK